MVMVTSTDPRHRSTPWGRSHSCSIRELGLDRQKPGFRIMASALRPSQVAPSGQGEHTEPPALSWTWKNPERQTQSLAASAPVPSVVPPSPMIPMQSVHAAMSPATSLYVPAGHRSHPDAADPKYPARQTKLPEIGSRVLCSGASQLSPDMDPVPPVVDPFGH